MGWSRPWVSWSDEDPFDRSVERGCVKTGFWATPFTNGIEVNAEVADNFNEVVRKTSWRQCGSTPSGSDFNLTSVNFSDTTPDYSAIIKNVQNAYVVTNDTVQGHSGLTLAVSVEVDYDY
jgi:hypothetical protein